MLLLPVILEEGCVTPSLRGTVRFYKELAVVRQARRCCDTDLLPAVCHQETPTHFAASKLS